MNIVALTLIFNTVTAQLHLPQGLLASICYVESKHDVNAVHHDDGGADSLGICQIKLQTARWLGFKGTKQQLMVPKNNIYYAGKYLQYNIKRYNEVTRAVVAYNRGNARHLVRSRYSDKVNNVWGKTKKCQKIPACNKRFCPMQ